ncbi:MAG: putative protease/transporter [Chloroflexi bacterium OLB14]|nr:MAG: putative protease/transporter [Chloroflexi bacterium OLB14]
MDFFLDPNFAYMILVAGVVLAFFSASTPGTGVGEVAALFCFVLAGYFVFELSIQWWAFFLLFLGIVPFVMAVRKPRQSVLYLSLCILLEVIGSVFLFPAKEDLISVNPILAIFVSAVMAVILWYILQKFIEVTSTRPAHDLEVLIGQVGVATSAIHKEGSVYVHGEDWSAKSDVKIPSGSHVRVVRREGFVLVVEKDNS